MFKETVTILRNRVEAEFLSEIRGPGRYIGGEVNQVKKDLNSCQIRAALCFPDVYEVGMSYLGMEILYNVLNNLDFACAERAFCPDPDAELIMRKNNLPLFTLENRAAVSDFDIMGFSLTNELCYTNMLTMLDLAGIPIRSENRDDQHPIIIAGGSISTCCEPIAPFVDVFVIGEGEETIVNLTELIKNAKDNNLKRDSILLQIAENFSWAYVPQFYQPAENENTDNYIEPKQSNLQSSFTTAYVKDFDNTSAIEKPIVPYADTVHERVSVEIMRGCPGRCRFCQASFTRRPIRFRSPEKIFEIAKKAYHATGFDTISLLSLSTADYPDLENLLENLHSYFAEKQVGISLPSLRVDQQLKLLPKFITSVRKGGLTIAVEAASEHLRKIINKPLTDEDLFAAVQSAYKVGWSKIKLYFMVGFPGEKPNDIIRIVTLANELAQLRKKTAGKTAQLNVAVSWLVPKPHTPFGWLGQKPQDYFENAKRLILNEKRNLRAGYLQFKFHNIQRSVLESAIGRSSRKLAPVIESAWKNGAKFDLWDEHFNFEIWQQAFESHSIDINEIAQKTFNTGQPLPWSHLGGPRCDYLLGHYEDAMTLAAQGV